MEPYSLKCMLCKQTIDDIIAEYTRSFDLFWKIFALYT